MPASALCDGAIVAAIAKTAFACATFALQPRSQRPPRDPFRYGGGPPRQGAHDGARRLGTDVATIAAWLCFTRGMKPLDGATKRVRFRTPAARNRTTDRRVPACARPASAEEWEVRMRLSRPSRPKGSLKLAD